MKAIDLSLDTSKLTIKANSTESEISSQLPSAATASIPGLELQTNQFQLVKVYPTGIEGPGAIAIDTTKNYSVCFVFHLQPGYDIPEAYKAYKYGNYTTVSKLPEFTVKVNGTKRDDVYFFYTDAYRTLEFIVPIKADIAAAVDNDDSGTYSGIETSIKKAGTPGTVWITGLKDKKYTGKKIKQSVTLKFNNTKMKAGTDYKITYKNNKNVGTATMTIKGLGKYYGTYTVTFKINPKPATISKITPAKKSATIKWKAVKTKMSKKKITGYKIQYSTSSKFKKSATKTKTIKGATKTSVKIKNLKSKKKYYFRIRTYMKVDGKTYYTTWSKTKNVKVK